MGGYTLVSPESLPSTPEALVKAADHAPTAAVGLLTKMAASMTSASIWSGLVGRGLVHGNLHTQAYAAEVMASAGLTIEKTEQLVALRAGRSALLLANKVQQRYVLTHSSLSPPLDSWGKLAVSHGTLYYQLEHMLDLTSPGSPVEIVLTNESDLGDLQKACVDFLSLSEEHTPVVNIESDAPGVIVDSVSAEELAGKFQSVNTLDPELSRHIIERHWRSLQNFF